MILAHTKSSLKSVRRDLLTILATSIHHDSNMIFYCQDMLYGMLDILRMVMHALQLSLCIVLCLCLFVCWNVLSGLLSFLYMNMENLIYA